jgi:hypothetical protein
MLEWKAQILTLLISVLAVGQQFVETLATNWNW